MELLPDAETCYRLKAGAASVTRVTLASEDMAVPRDSEEYKQLYDNIGVVGSGTFGSVYCAVERETEEYVAAKYMILQIEKVCYSKCLLVHTNIKKLGNSSF